MAISTVGELRREIAGLRDETPVRASVNTRKEIILEVGPFPGYSGLELGVGGEGAVLKDSQGRKASPESEGVDNGNGSRHLRYSATEIRRTAQAG
jgi:hypothetical protein